VCVKEIPIINISEEKALIHMFSILRMFSLEDGKAQTIEIKNLYLIECKSKLAIICILVNNDNIFCEIL